MAAPSPPYALLTAHTSAVLAEACQAALGSWHAAITEAIKARGISNASALRLATLVLAGIEGGLLLARAHHSSEPGLGQESVDEGGRYWMRLSRFLMIAASERTEV